jgi:hypothetical protein
VIEMAKAMNKLWADLYEGNGHENPSIVSRLLLLETGMSELKEAVTSINNNVKALFYIGISAVVGAVADMIMRHFK